MIEFVRYWCVTIPAKAIHIWWWDFVWPNFGWAAIIAIATGVLGAFWQSRHGTPSETLKQWLGSPMANIHDYITGIAIVLGVIVISFVICVLFVAPQQTHSERLTELQAARKQFEAAEQSLKIAKDQYSPGVKAIPMMVVMAYGAESGKPAAIWVLRVLNTGSPSVATGWSAILRLRDGRTVHGNLHHLDNPLSLKGPDGSEMILQPDDTLDEKCVRQPLAQGSQQTGYLYFSFDGISAEEMIEAINGSKTSLVFYDAREIRHEVNAHVVQQIDKLVTYTGMTTVVKLKEGDGNKSAEPTNK